jgi:hypothetical protein
MTAQGGGGSRCTIQVEPRGEDAFRVTVTEGGSRTTHDVTLASSYYQKLTKGTVAAEELVRCSFEFLLERESKESILRTFDLPVIGRYFPEYEREISRRF